MEEMVRGCAIGALGVLMYTGTVPRAEVSAYIGELFAGRLERKAAIYWEDLIALCGDFALAEHLDAIRVAYAENLLDPEFTELGEIEKQLAQEPETSEHVLWEDYCFVDDTTAEMEWWDCFDFPAEGDEEDSEPAEPIRREAPKIGRNDPCPCGSQKKYKKCCGKDS